MVLFQKFVCIFLYIQFFGPLSAREAASFDKNSKNLVYANLTIIHSDNGEYNVSYSIIPLKNSQINQYQREVEHMERQGLFFFTTPPPFSIEGFLKIFPTIPNQAAQTVGNLLHDVTNIFAINVTQVHRQRSPFASASTAASQVFNNIALCNPLLIGMNSSRCRGILQAKSPRSM